jgi:tyrosine aminotransferase
VDCHTSLTDKMSPLEKQTSQVGHDSTILPTSPSSIVPNAGVVEIEPIILPSALVKDADNWTTLVPSAKSQRTKNPIREIVDPIVASLRAEGERKDGKECISLAVSSNEGPVRPSMPWLRNVLIAFAFVLPQLGDPTIFGNFTPCPALSYAVSPTSGAGYVNALGIEEARQAIAAYHSEEGSLLQYQPDDVIVASGCSGTLELVLTALLDPGTFLLVPQPGFPLYEVIAKSHGAAVLHYRLRSDHNWQVDTDHVRELIRTHGNRVRGILINNPSNPTGAVYTFDHLRDIVQLCDDCRLPIVADEIYGNLVYGSNQFVPLARVSASMGRRVPVITCSGLAKQFLLPGWRIGWALFQDNCFGSLCEVEGGVKSLAQVILGASHLPQTAVPVLLDRTNTDITAWKEDIRLQLELQAECITLLLSKVPGLKVLPSGGAMYMMVYLQRNVLEERVGRDDQIFCRALLLEENVFVLPGSCFGFPGAFRIVFSAPIAMLEEAADRIEQFCGRHQK